MTRPLLEILGWVGSALVILSLAQARVLRFRMLNQVGAALAVGYNVALAICPLAVMNAIIAVIDLCWLRRLLTERHDPAACSVVAVAPTDGCLGHVLGVHLDDIRTFQPSYAVPSGDARRWAFLVQRDAETVGAVVVRDDGDGSGVRRIPAAAQDRRGLATSTLCLRSVSVRQHRHGRARRSGEVQRGAALRWCRVRRGSRVQGGTGAREGRATTVRRS